MRFAGTVGFATSTEVAPGVWQDVITERSYFGDVLRLSRRLEAPPMVPPLTNDGLALENSFSIVADADAYQNYMHMRYVKWEDAYWQITNVEVKRPRLILTIGGLWNGTKA